MDTFLPVYLNELGNFLAHSVPPDQLLPALLAGTQAMLDNNLPDRTLKDAFDQTFYPSLDIDSTALLEKFEQFYAEIFPSLKNITEIRPEAISMVKEAFKRGYSIAIATNPLFPRTAILQRLEWAELSPELYPFNFIPSYENFHFAKPNPAFFTESLGLLGWPSGAVIMVGDDFEHDIEPARQLGMGNYWVREAGLEPEDGSPSNAGGGSIGELMNWIDNLNEVDLQPDLSLIKSMLAVLRSTPAVVDNFSMQLESQSWVEHPQPKEWNFTEIMCHLRDVDAEVNLPRIQRVLGEEDPFFSGIDTDKWAQERLYYCQSGPDALKDFVNTRIQLLEVLDSLPEAEWYRPARHAIFGPTNLKELVGIIVGHDQLHTQQAFNILVDLSKQSISSTSG